MHAHSIHLDSLALSFEKSNVIRRAPRALFVAALLLVWLGGAVACKSDENKADDGGGAGTSASGDGGPSGKPDSSTPGLDASQAKTDSSTDGEDTGVPSEKDASTGDAGGGGDGWAKACAASEICDDFETGVGFDSSTWTAAIEYGDNGDNCVAEVTTDKAYRGKRSAHFQLKANKGGAVAAYIIETKTAATLGEHLWGRMYFFADYDGSRGHMYFTKAGTTNPTSKYLEIGQGGSMGQWQLTAWGSPEYPVGYAGKVPQKRWACMEWEMTKSSGDMTLYIDGDEVAAFSTPSAANWCPFDEVRIGVAQYGGSTYATDADVWVDDVVLASDRIGCD